MELGDRVEYFRAKADMERWQEQWELKQAEALRTVSAFRKMKDVWKTCAEESGDNDGKRAIALKESATYDRLQETLQSNLVKSGYGHLLVEGESLVQIIENDRLDPEKAFERTDPEHLQ